MMRGESIHSRHDQNLLALHSMCRKVDASLSQNKRHWFGWGYLDYKAQTFETSIMEMYLASQFHCSKFFNGESQNQGQEHSCDWEGLGHKNTFSGSQPWQYTPELPHNQPEVSQGLCGSCWVLLSWLYWVCYGKVFSAAAQSHCG